MIIFDLDGTLADCEHRRHFIDPNKAVDHILQGYDGNGSMIEENGIYCNIIDGKRFKPNWKSFYEACDKDKPIKPTINLLRTLWVKEGEDIEIWSGRCESVRSKTEYWINSHIAPYFLDECRFKMRTIGDSTPDDQLKERWLNEALAEGKEIDFVFDDRPKVIRMWRRRGIFVFDVNQNGKDF